MRFANRAEAGRALAEHLRAYAGRSDVVVLALPRGGVAVGFESPASSPSPWTSTSCASSGCRAAKSSPWAPIASDGTRVLNTAIVSRLANQRPGDREHRARGGARARAARARLQERARRDRRARAHVILVDDGLATGASMRVAALALRAREPERLVIAVPVAPRDVCEELGSSSTSWCASRSETGFARSGRPTRTSRRRRTTRCASCSRARRSLPARAQSTPG